MSDNKLGPPALSDPARVEELEDILKGVMRYVDKWVTAEDMDKDEVTRAKIMYGRVTKIIDDKSKRIKELKYSVERANKLCDAAMFLLGRQVE